MVVLQKMYELCFVLEVKQRHYFFFHFSCESYQDGWPSQGTTIHWMSLLLNFCVGSNETDTSDNDIVVYECYAQFENVVLEERDIWCTWPQTFMDM